LAAFSMPGKLPTHNRRSALERRCAKDRKALRGIRSLLFRAGTRRSHA
jgi:hypothetical protein